jgi:hypothetical protein
VSTKGKLKQMKFAHQVAAVLLAVVSLTVFSSAQKPVRAFELQGASPQFWDLVDHDAKLGTVAG